MDTSKSCSVCGARECTHLILVIRTHRKRQEESLRPVCNTHAAQAATAGYAVKELA